MEGWAILTLRELNDHAVPPEDTTEETVVPIMPSEPLPLMVEPN